MGLTQAVIESLENDLAGPYHPQGPFKTVVTMRDGEKIAQKLAQRWGHRCEGANIFITTDDIHKLYLDLIRMCSLTPLIEKILPLALAVSNLRGRLGMSWLRRGEMVSKK